MIESGFVFTQISTTNLNLHTKGLGSAINPPKRLGFGSCFFWRFVQIGDTYIKTRRRCNIY
ncbi:hypothetical protein LINGRAHAP2_LOCUS32533, partial [Linum grandiflorum]